jgi:hypothetical protein
VCVVGLAVALVPASAFAQGRPFGRLALSIGQGYEDNLFSSPASGNPQTDFVTRFGPLFEGGYTSPASSLLARYGVDAERYVEHKELDNNRARQEALVSLKHSPGPRLALELEGAYLDTQTPRELNEATLISAGRARAQRVRGLSAMVYDFNPVMKLSADFTFHRDLIEGGQVTTTQTPRVGVSFHPDARTTYRSNYSFSHLTFGDGVEIYSVAMTGGLVRTITPSWVIEIDAGPRLSSGDLRPELAAQLKKRLRRGEVAIAAFATEDTVYGQIGTVQVRRLTGTWTHTPVRAVSFRVTPAAVESLYASSPVTVYEVDGDVTIRANSKLSFVIDGHYGRQNGTFSNGTFAPIQDYIPVRWIGARTVVTLQ